MPASRKPPQFSVIGGPVSTTYRRFGGLFAGPQGHELINMFDSATVLTITSPAAAAIADLTTIESDLQDVIARCDAYAATDDQLTKTAMYEAALIAYGRCFSTGRSAQGRAPRRTIRDLIGRLPAALQADHEELHGMRNRHVGHRTDQVVSLVLAEFDSEGRFEDVNRITWALGSNTGHIESLSAVCAALLELVGEAVTRELHMLRESLREAMISPTESVPG